jgi:hypothetical protein
MGTFADEEQEDQTCLSPELFGRLGTPLDAACKIRWRPLNMKAKGRNACWSPIGLSEYLGFRAALHRSL